ncbi:MAG: hypothetical protein MJA29_14380 [Candidatus Omnitrophica bacterium]|nr:hypothetical protein [Candidatus Omnitrophota bacterium]
MPSLQPRGKWIEEESNMAVGDVVLMMDRQNPRGNWPLAKIMEVMPSGDGLVRSVKVKAKGKEFIRPITKLVPLVSSKE